MIKIGGRQFDKGFWFIGICFPLITLTINLGVAFELSMYMLLIIMFGVYHGIHRIYKNIYFNYSELAYTGLFFLMALSLLYVPDFEHSLIKVIKIFLLVLIYILSKNVFRNVDSIRIIMKFSSISLILYLIYLSYNYIFIGGLNYIGIDVESYGITGRNSLALVLVIVLSFEIGSIYGGENKNYWISYIIIVFLTAGTFLLQSRGAIVSIVIGTLVISLKEKRIRNLKKLLSILIFGLLIFVIFAPESLKSQMLERLLSIIAAVDSNVYVDEGAGSTELRKSLINISLGLFSEQPLTGIGFGGFSEFNAWGYSGPHNDYLLFLSELGIFGFLLYVFIVFNFTKMAYKNYKYSISPETSGIFFAMVSLCFFGFFMNAYDNILVWSIYSMTSVLFQERQKKLQTFEYKDDIL